MGREREVGRLDRFLAALQAGEGPLLVVRGPVGSGKTALLAATRNRPGPDFDVVETGGRGSPTKVPFGGLLDLARPLLRHVDALAPGRADALRGEFGLGIRVGDDLALADALLELFLAAARERPVVLLVDDAQWLDDATAACLDYAIARFGSARVGLLAALRDDAPAPDWLDPLPTLDVTPLDDASARTVLAVTAPDLRSSALDTVVRWAAGNPLALHELPGLLTPNERRGVVDAAEPIRPPRRVQLAIERRISLLDADAQHALLIVATAHSQNIDELAAAGAALALDRAAFTRVEDAGLIVVDHDGGRCEHPLVRSVAYHRAPVSARRAVHRALAESVAGAERGWHLAASATGTDESIAAALEAVGTDARNRGAHATAASALESAARLSPEPEDTERRLLLAAECAVYGATSSTALRLLADVRPDLRNARYGGPTARHLAGMAMLGSPPLLHEAIAQLRLAADADAETTPGRASIIAADAAFGAVIVGDLAQAVELSQRAYDLLGAEGDARMRAPALAARSAALAYVGRVAESEVFFDDFTRLVPQLAPGVAARHLSRACRVRLATGDPRLVLAMVDGAARASFDAGTFRPAAALATTSADACYRLGQWDRCEEEARGATDLFRRFGERTGELFAMAVLARVLAARGAEQQCRAAADEVLSVCEPARVNTIVAIARSALGLLDLGLGAVDAAIDTLEPVGRLVPEFAQPSLVGWGPDLVEALVMAGRLDDAHKVNDTLRDLGGVGSDLVTLAAVARGDGLLARDDYDECFARALALHGRLPMPFEMARTQLAFGARLHRAKRRGEAREQLLAARMTFEQLGARPWIARADAELSAAGSRARRDAGDPSALTDREARIARGVADGCTNREMASELFLSVKTIEFHLSRIFDKLGVRSRTQVAAVVLRADQR